MAERSVLAVIRAPIGTGGCKRRSKSRGRANPSVLCVLLCLLPGCDGSAVDSPTSPSRDGAAPSNFSATVLPQLGATIVRFSWMPAVGATAYAVEVGRSFRTADVVTLAVTGGQTHVEWRPEPGRYFARVRAAQSGGATSGPSNDVEFLVIHVEDAIEALFLQSGRLVSRCDPNWPAAMVGFPRGVTLRFRISTTLSSRQIEVARETALRIPELSHGAFHSVIDVTSEIPEARELRIATVQDHDVVMTRGMVMGANAVAGIVWADQARGVFRAGIISMDATADDYVVRHEMGHMPLGLCHIAAGELLSTGSLMSAPRGPAEFTALDLEVLRAVYTSGLPPGATRSEFAAAGLVRP